MRLGFLNKIRAKKKKAELIGEIKIETINITAMFGEEFTNQFFLLVLKLFCSKTDVVYLLFFWFI